MAKYTVLADVGKAIVDMLKDQLVPEPVAKKENIGLCDPKERGSFVVGVHPYDVEYLPESRNRGPIQLPDGNLQNPPISYSVKYMISISSKAEIANRGIDEQRILGRLMQVFADNSSIPEKYMSGALKMANEPIGINMQTIELEEKVKVWSMFSEPYKLSAFYTVGPINVDSTVIRVPSKRVVSVDIKSKLNK